MRVAMIGAGYVGLVSAVCFSEFGLTVSCVDSDPERIAALRAGRIPIYEPGWSRCSRQMLPPDASPLPRTSPPPYRRLMW